METCVVESQKMYLSTPKSVTYRKHVLRDKEPGEFVSCIAPKRQSFVELRESFLFFSKLGCE